MCVRMCMCVCVCVWCVCVVLAPLALVQSDTLYQETSFSGRPFSKVQCVWVDGVCGWMVCVGCVYVYYVCIAM